MAFQSKREKAESLRRKGCSLQEISDRLKTSKSTISYWCRNIALSDQHIRTLAEKQKTAGALGRLRAAELKRNARILHTRKAAMRGASDVGKINRRDLMMLGIALYWGEGYKNGNEECGLTNSDPALILTFIAWLERIYTIHKNDLILRVSVNIIHQNRINDVEQFWSKVTGIPRSQFTKASLIRSKTEKKYSDLSKHMGTLRVKVRRATSLRRRIIGSVNEVSRQIILQ